MAYALLNARAKGSGETSDARRIEPEGDGHGIRDDHLHKQRPHGACHLLRRRQDLAGLGTLHARLESR